MAAASDYTDLITSEHDQQPNFMATVEALVMGFVDGINVLNTIPNAFSLDNAVGVQLDQVGQWIGFSRNVPIPLPPNLFQLDVVGSGFDEGTWQGPGNPLSGLVVLDDDTYRTMLYIKVGANSWDGSLEQMQTILAAVFSDPNAVQNLAVNVGYDELAVNVDYDVLIAAGPPAFFVVDNQDMTAGVFFLGTLPSVTLLSMFENGYMPIKPEGVQMDYWKPSSGSTYFGFDLANGAIQGFDIGSWPTHA
jgi:hypothetical protein